MYQPDPSSGQPVRPLPSLAPAPAPMLAAVKLMYAGAAISAVPLIIALAYIVGDKPVGRWQWNGHSLTAAQDSRWWPLIITATIVFGLVVPALWLWLAWANGHGKNWARIASTVLFGLATLQLSGALKTPVSHAGFGVEVPGLIVLALTWLAGLAAVWLLWRPGSSAFFKLHAAPAA